jgi:hypothetical protein
MSIHHALTGEVLTETQVAHRSRMLEKLLAFQREQGCRGCRQSERDSVVNAFYALTYDKLCRAFRATFGMDCE